MTRMEEATALSYAISKQWGIIGDALTVLPSAKDTQALVRTIVGAQALVFAMMANYTCLMQQTPLPHMDVHDLIAKEALEAQKGKPVDKAGSVNKGIPPSK